jgi:hypothetical protein
MDARLDEVRQLVHEHLNAAMIMVPLDDPLDPEMSIADALTYLDRNEFDLALLATPELRVVYRDQLRQVIDVDPGRPVAPEALSPRSDRLIEHSLELGEVAERLQADATPLLVVGRHGPEFIVTRADFTRPAGRAGVLAVLAALDAQLDELLRPFDSEAWELLPSQTRDRVERLARRAHDHEEEVHRLAYLTLGERFELVRKLNLASRFGVDLGDEHEQQCVIDVRNDLAHSREFRSGTDILRALEIAETLHDVVTAVLQRRTESGMP